jgi:hypothetical protein
MATMPQTQSVINSATAITAATSVPWKYANSSIALPPIETPAAAIGVAGTIPRAGVAKITQRKKKRRPVPGLVGGSSTYRGPSMNRAETSVGNAQASH